MSRIDAASCASFAAAAAEDADSVVTGRAPPSAAVCGEAATGLAGSAVRRLRLAMRRSSTRVRYDVSTCKSAQPVLQRVTNLQFCARIAVHLPEE